jgi:uncharacterized membrane protein
MEDTIYSKEEIEEGKSAAILAYIPFACLVSYLKWKDNRFAHQHARQGIALFIFELIAVMFLIPGMAELLFKLILTISVILAIIGIVYVLQDREWKIPYIGDWIDRKAAEKADDF